jgi:hypothetical protein
MVRCPAGLAVAGCPVCEGTGFRRIPEGVEGEKMEAFICPEFDWAQKAKADIAIIEAT